MHKIVKRVKEFAGTSLLLALFTLTGIVNAATSPAPKSVEDIVVLKVENMT